MSKGVGVRGDLWGAEQSPTHGMVTHWVLKDGHKYVHQSSAGRTVEGTQLRQSQGSVEEHGTLGSLVSFGTEGEGIRHSVQVAESVPIAHITTFHSRRSVQGDSSQTSIRGPSLANNHADLGVAGSRRLTPAGA